MASRHPGRNEEEGPRELLLQPTLEQQLNPPAKSTSTRGVHILAMLMPRVLHFGVGQAFQPDGARKMSG